VNEALSPPCLDGLTRNVPSFAVVKISKDEIVTKSQKQKIIFILPFFNKDSALLRSALKNQGYPDVSACDEELLLRGLCTGLLPCDLGDGSV
jgi:hypothetical protein